MTWKTVRYDPTWKEPLDPEMIPLCDALNAAGFVTTSSCVGHGCTLGPYVCFEHSSDERIEKLVRFVKGAERGDFRPYFSEWQKEILLDGYAWSVRIHVNEIYRDTPAAVREQREVDALAHVTRSVQEFWKGGHPPMECLDEMPPKTTAKRKSSVPR
jgi:hypothetical protein